MNRINPEAMLYVSAAPHIRSAQTIQQIMWNVVLALLPAAAFSMYLFGSKAAVTIFYCVATCVVTEYVLQYWQKKDITINDGSAVITGLLLAMNIPAGLPWYMCITGSVVAIAIAKHTMGGLGYNIFNPALIGRAFLLASWPIAMTTWPKINGALSAVSSATKNGGVDSLTAATPLGTLKYTGYNELVESFGGHSELYTSLFLGLRGGSLGETSCLLLLIGGLFLIYRGIISWQVPFSMIATVGVLGWAFGGQNGLFSGDALMHMMSGGLFLGAFFMATDMVTTPITTKGRIIFACGAGCIVMLIRLKGGYPEGVCYSILLMNSLTPLIDRLCKPTVFGERR